MNNATLLSGAVRGLNVSIIEVEVDISFGLKNFLVVGLPDRAVRESCGRVESAIKNSGLPFPRFRVTINLAPAHIKKEGASYDLPMAIGILVAEGHIKTSQIPENALFIGELGLDGNARHVDGILSIALAAKQEGVEILFVPECNAEEAAIVEDLTIVGVTTLTEAVEHLTGNKIIEPAPRTVPNFHTTIFSSHDLRDVRGQERAKRALEIAAAGAHNILFSGPPGSGKTMLARTLPSILPALTFDEALDITRIHSVAGTLKGASLVQERPFRAPHHTASGVALVGGGAAAHPGEISLAHRGVLFLDEFPEFNKSTLENLRQPLEDGTVTVSRAAGTFEYPAQFMLIAAMNPCPCGYASDPFHPCVCTPAQITKYQKKLSGPLLDRIDLHIEVPKIDVDKLVVGDDIEPSKDVRERVQIARDRQTKRFENLGIVTNSDMSARDVQKICKMEEKAHTILTTATRALHLSARAYIRTIKVARTIADLSGDAIIQDSHIAEALQFRARGE